jgi:hypothetical protein
MNEMGRAGSAYGGEVYSGCWWGNVRERDHLGDPGVDGRIILRCIFRKWNVGECIGSSWRALVNMVMNPWVPYNVGNFVISRKTVSFLRRTLLHGVSKKSK